MEKQANNAWQLLQRAADFYATLDNSFDSMSSSGSDSSYRSTPERRVSTTSSNVVAQVKSSIPDKIEVSQNLPRPKTTTCNLRGNSGDVSKTAPHNEHIGNEKNAIKKNSKARSPSGSRNTSFSLDRTRSRPKKLRD